MFFQYIQNEVTFQFDASAIYRKDEEEKITSNDEEENDKGKIK